ncbi:MAG: glycosyltransferase family 4 protein [Armatimonadetes bacterium]|nr:glycosyltransferase family 4 protein [Armatimonadota bacterium]
MTAPKLQILQVITARRFYGAEHVLLHLCEGLRDRGHDVSVACKPNADLERELGLLDIPVFAMPIGGKLNLAAPVRLARLARRLHVDVIHTHLSSASLWGSVAGRLAGIPVIAEVHALNSRWSFMLAHHIVTCSEGVRQHMIGLGVPPPRLDVLYNGLPARLFEGLKDGAAVRRELGLSPTGPVIGAVAHLSPRKGHRHLLEAVLLLRARFPDLVCLLVGEGEALLELEELAEQMGIKAAVRFLGFRPDAIQLVAGLDVVVLPSVAKEGLGVALIEAGFLGKPTVGSDCPGIDEVIVDGETGLLVPPGDSWALAEAITGLLSDPTLSRRLGAAARERMYRHFTVETMAARAEEIYLELLRKRRRLPPVG